MSRLADIICFSKDWNEPATSNNHVMVELSKRHRVLWVNSIATRNPNLASAHDLKKIVRKLRSWFRGVEVVSANLRVFTPVVMPLPNSRLAQAFNRRLVSSMVRAVARKWGFGRPQLWIFPPNAADYIGQFHESMVVYYCTDEWAEFSHVSAGLMREKEARLLRKADAVIVVSRKLEDAKRKSNPNTHLVPHGVDHRLFSQALSAEFPVAPELEGLPRPVIGFYGNLYDWVDQRLLSDIARSRPAWSIVLVGKIMSDISTLRECPNIRILGYRPHETLPAFCKGFDAGIIPYRVQDPRMQSVSPLKLREYLAAGLPVVSVDIPEARGLTPEVLIAEDAQDFVVKLERALAQDSPEAKQARSRAMESETWTARVARIEHILGEVESSRAGSPVGG